MSDDIIKLIDKETREYLKEPRRRHLGASQIGTRCARQSWYEFRWAYEVDALGPMRRLWNRGHEEEHRVIRWLRASGYEIRDYTQRLMYHDGSDSYVCFDWDYEWGHGDEALLDDVSEDRVHIERATKRGQGPKQWGFRGDIGMFQSEGHDQQGNVGPPTMSHFGGHNDGKIRGPKLPDGWGGFECKTSNEKNFKELRSKGVLVSKPVHWVQMQIYMRYLGLTWCLYIAVNKNNDHIHAEVVYYQEEIAEKNIDHAFAIINAKDAPKRLSNDPSWFECKWCDYREICHYNQTPQKNCRSCAFSEPVENKEWRCNKFHGILPSDFIPKGCDGWNGIK